MGAVKKYLSQRERIEHYEKLMREFREFQRRQERWNEEENSLICHLDVTLNEESGLRRKGLKDLEEALHADWQRCKRRVLWGERAAYVGLALALYLFGVFVYWLLR